MSENGVCAGVFSPLFGVAESFKFSDSFWGFFSGNLDMNLAKQVRTPFGTCYLPIGDNAEIVGTFQNELP